MDIMNSSQETFFISNIKYWVFLDFLVKIGEKTTFFAIFSFLRVRLGFYLIVLTQVIDNSPALLWFKQTNEKTPSWRLKITNRFFFS
jgi:hypothetical protein